MASLIHIITSPKRKLLAENDISMTFCIFLIFSSVGFFWFFSVLVDSTASVCFLVFNLCWAVNCPSNNLSDAATEGDPDYKTLYANAKPSCLMAAAQSFVLSLFTSNRHKSSSLLRHTSCRS